jgi:hypothetical protein
MLIGWKLKHHTRLLKNVHERRHRKHREILAGRQGWIKNTDREDGKVGKKEWCIMEGSLYQALPRFVDSPTEYRGA